MTAPQPGTEGLDFHLTDAEKSGDVEVDENGYAQQPGTEGLDFHLTPEDKKADDAVKEKTADELAEDKRLAELQALAKEHGVSGAGSKHDIALRLAQAGYPQVEGAGPTVAGTPA